jgi:hypothetical protein
MLQADWKEPLQICGMLTPQLMTPLIPSPSRSSEQIQGVAHTQRSDEAQEARVPCTKIGINVCE